MEFVEGVVGGQHLREGPKKNVFLGLCPKHRTPPTHRARLGQSPKKKGFFYNKKQSLGP